METDNDLADEIKVDNNIANSKETESPLDKVIESRVNFNDDQNKCAETQLIPENKNQATNTVNN